MSAGSETLETQLPVVDPASGAVVAAYPVDDAASVGRAFLAARAAQPAWAGLAFRERCARLGRFRDLLRERTEPLARLLTSETGKPVSQARAEISATPARVDFFLEQLRPLLLPRVMYGDPTWAGPPGAGALDEVVTYEPLGVVANVSAWNYPYFVGANVFVPALLSGSAVLYKPSEFAPGTGLAIASLLHEVGVPRAVFAPLVGGAATGAAVVAQPVDGVFFTGSYATGARIARASAGRMIPVQLELGGKDPAYVCADADPLASAAALADGAFSNNGQSCCSVERIYVHTDVYDRFVEAFVSNVQAMVLGDPGDEQTYLGPVTREAHLAELQRQVDDAVAGGARVLCGGRRAARPGWFYEPTVLVGVTDAMAVMRDETFGPVIGIARVADDAEAVDRMNDSEYGLTAAVFTPDRAHAVSVLGAVRSGTAYWNCCDRVSARLPWGGRGHSGVGVTLGLDGARAFLRPRAWHLRSA